MLFNSFSFALFLPVVFLLYWFVFKRKLVLQNLFLIAVSYFFYACWDWRFLFLLIFSSVLDFSVGVLLDITKTDFRRKLILALSIIVNLGILGFFKYFNFFADSFADLAHLAGWKVSPVALKIILPVGVSFYTFQSLSYAIDSYRRKLIPTREIIPFLAFVSFFPQLVAGPIERAVNLLPQFHRKREFNNSLAVDGMRQILWGLFKKVVVADNVAPVVDDIFKNYQHYSGGTLFLGAFLFSVQIYCDFSGYSDIAIGTARLFGFNLKRNFAFPYFSRDIAEFWRRWHISLSSWFRDYVYFPLGGSQVSLGKQIRNTFVIFLLSGFWHGANWTFLVWGGLNAIYFLPLLLTKSNRNHTGVIDPKRVLPTPVEFFRIVITFLLTTLAWVFFRAENIQTALHYLKNIFTFSVSGNQAAMPVLVYGFILLMFIVEWLQRDKEHGLQIAADKLPQPIRWCIYFSLGMLISLYFGTSTSFIYFQF